MRAFLDGLALFGATRPCCRASAGSTTLRLIEMQTKERAGAQSVIEGHMDVLFP